MVQVIAMQTGRKLKQVPSQIAKSVFQGVDSRSCAFKHFAALKRLLDRDEPDYAR